MDFSSIDAEQSLIITASQRQSRYLRDEFAAQQIAQGLDVWPSLKVMPWNAFINYCWELAQESGLDMPIRLSSNQGRHLWQQMVASSDVVEPLLNRKQTQNLSFDAWRVCQQWQIEHLGAMPGDQDQESFAEWFSTFTKDLQSHGWIEAHQQANYLLKNLPSFAEQLPNTIVTYGFQQPTPQQSTLIELLKDSKDVVNWALEVSANQEHVQLCSLPDPSQELIAAVRWAKQKLLKDSEQTIAIVVPELEQKKSYIERLIYREFYVGDLVQGKELTHPLHDFSIDESLLQQPLVAVVTDWLTLTYQGLSKKQLQHLLLSPYLYNEQESHWQATQFELIVRKSTKAYYSIEDLLKLSRHHQVKLPWLTFVDEWLKQNSEALSAKQGFKSHIAVVLKLLAEVHWTGYHSITSREYQVQQTFIEAIKSAQSLQKVLAGKINFAKSISLLKEHLEQQTFHQQQPKAPLQIMGMLEAIGITFDAVWLVGATDQVLPQKATPNPFISKAIHRKFDLPGSSHNREVEYAHSLLQSLLANPELVISFAEYDGEQEQMMSPLLKTLLPNHTVHKQTLESQLPGELTEWPINGALEYYGDDKGLTVGEHYAVKGGTGLLRMQAASPFDAYLRYRLALQPFEEDGLGISFMDRGNLFHKAMQIIWTRLETQSALLELSDDALEGLVKQTAQFVLNEAAKHIYLLQNQAFMDVEAKRLEALIMESLDLDKKREPFTVIGTEVPREVELAGLKFSIIIDRIDKLRDGRLMIIDYKTGQPTLMSLLRDPIAEPQLLLYAISEQAISEQSNSDSRDEKQGVAGIVFMQAHLKACKYIGITSENDMLEGVKALHDIKANPYSDDFDEAIEQWKGMLEEIAESFKNGHADITEYSGDFTDHLAISRWSERGESLEALVNGGEDYE
ncbi:PD-(D/E)XK nuclease family protein [Kangiella japonica]|uniref:PD-(D/E)XK nuclease family protein n=1 Tax=Kangiella japonica TaxID=647384 RepID=A0ABP3CDQ2_9GAMM